MSGSATMVWEELPRIYKHYRIFDTIKTTTAAGAMILRHLYC